MADTDSISWDMSDVDEAINEWKNDEDVKGAEVIAAEDSGSIFKVDDNLAKTYVFSLGKGDTYFNVDIKPIKTELDIKNSKKHEGAMSAIITSLNVSSQERIQVNYTLGKTVYLYTFGESLYDLSISGFGYVPCTYLGEESDSNAFKDLLDFYDKNKVGKHGKYCEITFGGEKDSKQFKGYLTQGDIGATNEAVGLVAFKFTFLGVMV